MASQTGQPRIQSAVGSADSVTLSDGEPQEERAKTRLRDQPAADAIAVIDAEPVHLCGLSAASMTRRPPPRPDRRAHRAGRPGCAAVPGPAPRLVRRPAPARRD